MLRTIIENDGKLALGSFVTAGAYKTGMGVTKDEATGKATIPSAETAEDIYFLNKERIPTGRNAALNEHSDYDTEYNTFAEGEHCKLEVYYTGEKFAVDQYNADTLVASAAGKRVSVGTDGKLGIATIASKYEFVGLYNDAGHTLALIEVKDSAVENS